MDCRGSGFYRARGPASKRKHFPPYLADHLKASGDEAHYRALLQRQGLSEVVKLKPAIPYHEALVEMLNADGLLLFQGANCNHQIPAKLYEYLRAGRPVLALTDPGGDTAAALRDAGAGKVVRIDSRAEIGEGVLAFLEDIRAGELKIGSKEVQKYSRQMRTRELAATFDALIA